MRTRAHRPNTTDQTTANKFTGSRPARVGHGRESELILRAQRTIGNRAAQQLLDGGLSIFHDFGSLAILPVRGRVARGGSHTDIPVLGAAEGDIVDQPVRGGATTRTPAPAASESCRQPRSMHKLTSGTFLGGLTMDSYFPDLTGRGLYNHPDTAGTFDTGSRAGANIQLYGVIPSPCRPSRFQLEQRVTRTRFRINGVAHAEEGRTFDDIAKSGRDASRPPFRQEFLGGGTAPLGYIISMADPPSTGYDSKREIEHDRDFVTSLVGPGGRQSVAWSLSTRMSRGTVTRNVLT